MGDYFTKELYEDHRFATEDPVKLCGASIVSFESVWDPIEKNSLPLDIFVTSVLSLSDQRWLLLDSE